MRVSTTAIESFRLWSDPEQEWMPESELIDTIKGVFNPTKRMMLGQAFGRCLEKPGKYRTDDGGYRVPVRVGTEWVDYLFDDELMDPCLAVFDRRGVFEAKTGKQYDDVTVIAKVDQLLGTGIVENKAKLSQFDFDKYGASYQWRFMLDLFEGATSVRYNVFLLDENKDDCNYELRGIESFNLYPYPGLHDDCVEMVRKFKEYVITRGLDEHLKAAAVKWGGAA